MKQVITLPKNDEIENNKNGAIIEYYDIIMQLHGIIITPNLPIATAFPKPVALSFVGYNSVVN